MSTHNIPYFSLCITHSPACYRHRIFAQDFVMEKKKKKRCFYVKHGIAILFSALLTEFPGAKACHISLGSKIGELLQVTGQNGLNLRSC